MSLKPTTVEEAQTDIREHAQGIVTELGSLVHEASGGSEIRDTLMRVAKQTAALDSCIRDTQQSLLAAQNTVVRLASKVEDTNEQLKALPKVIDIVKVASADL
ncbi:hypothetical protein GGI25_005868 [Coemansia spiralis]|uniref:BLOC-1-related complex subunit 7 n=2 Tax=Coemansia TaxID=4863 RepID=A0A9W8G3W0_9FUNG|nr:hypothetical protein BX070DRAFT_237122 [Coemansia spiralis]KAJ1989421.1 hypothetical protein EDC05_004679 [Coemansia umbellata]KAJ2620369.1 hypothetical protein GGI26_005078 [Coemansia sp. RSA 1358]KAJ2670370.1 hypothetical protein GGI25_005868 [Coemansia spiralis]